MYEGLARCLKIQLLLLFIASATIYGQEFNLLRQKDDLSTMDSIEFKNLYQRLKTTNLSQQTKLSFGGSWRFQAESFINSEFNSQGNQDNIWYLNRFMVHSHFTTSVGFEIFAELAVSVVGGKDDLSPVDRNQLYVNQFFGSYKFDQRWSVSVGRQNMRHGSGRLVDLREGPNVRRSLDMLSLNYRGSGFNAFGFFSVPVLPQPGIFDDDFLEFNETFSGVYTTTRISESSTMDAYIYYQKDDNTTYNFGTQNERRSSVGIRHFGSFNKFIFNNEAVYQFGRFGSHDISAWTLSFHLERKLTMLGRDFGLGIKTEAISGDRDAADNQLNTFDALYPRGAYFGRVARFGPSNLLDIHPYLNLEINKWHAEVDYNAFWRYSTQDGVYGPSMTLDYPSNNNERFIAHQIGTNLSYQLNNHINIQLESNIIFPGEFLIQSDKGDLLYHFVLTTEFRF